MKTAMRIILFAGVFLAGMALTAAQNPIHVTYLWHMHQPNYYPYNSVNDIDSWGLFNFSVAGVHNDRSGPYGAWPKNAVQAGHDRGLPHAGVQVSFTGSLMENLNGLWSSNWRDHYRHAWNLKTTLGNPRMDLVGIANHHSLMPLTSRESMIMQIRLHREVHTDTWNTGGEYTKGFFPPESSFATRMIPALVDQGIEWVLVDNGHLFRTLEDFPWSDASSIRPNRADVRNSTAASHNSAWVQLHDVWAPTPVAAPWSYLPHRIRYVEPDSHPNNPVVHSMIAVPAGRYEGNENARGGYGAFKPDNVWGPQVHHNNDPDRPMLIVCHSDGDNHGMLNEGSYGVNHADFLDMIQANADFAHTTVQDYLDLYPTPPNYIHVEPGSWIGLDGGTPYFEKWIEDNAVDGEHPDHWSWHVLIAAQNRVLHAEDLEGEFTINDVRYGTGPDTAKAWRYYLVAETSCYWYWDFDRTNPWDGNVTRAANLAITEANKVINRHPGVDRVGPSILPPQRPIWNPGGKHWNESGNQPSDFEVWTFIDDVSGVADARLYWRTADWDSYADLNEFRHEVYAHTPGLNSEWNIESMTNVLYPPVRGPLVDEPLNRAERYSGWITDQSDTLISYFVEAVDNAGNTNRSDIFHVWVGQYTGTGNGNGDDPGPGGVVWTVPEVPVAGQEVTIYYNPEGRGLPSTSSINIHHGYNGGNWTTPPGVPMTQDGDYWTFTYVVPESATSLVMCFNHNGQDPWDNNSGNNFTIAVSETAPEIAVWIDPATPVGCDPITIYYDPTDRPLDGVNPVYIHLGRNGWNDIEEPNPAMTFSEGVWTYTYTPPIGTTNIMMAFNDGDELWDSNNGQNWAFTIQGCELPTGFLIFVPDEDILVGHAVETYTLQGVADGAQGHLTWSNALTGAWGTMPVASPWTLPDVALGVGDNVITVSGTNTVPEGTVTNAADSAVHSAYNGGWSTGLNGGTGFEAWDLFRDTDDNDRAGFFTSLNNKFGKRSWGLYANNEHISEARRNLSEPLAVGETFHVKFGNRQIQNGGGVGIALQNAATQTLWEFYFNGGDDYYSMTGSGPNIGWTTNGLEIEFTLTGPTNFMVKILPYGSSAQTYTGHLAVQNDSVIRRVRVWNYNAGSGQDHNLLINDLAVTVPGEGGVVLFSDTVTITREADGETDTNGDGVWDSFYIGHGLDHTDPDVGRTMAPNGYTYRDSFFMNLDPDDEETPLFRLLMNGTGAFTLQAPTGRLYQVEYIDDLMHPVWSNLHMISVGEDIEDNGNALRRYYRVRFHGMEE